MGPALRACITMGSADLPFVEPVDWANELPALCRERLGSLALEIIQRQGTAVKPDVVRSLRENQYAVAERTMHMQNRTLSALQVLFDEGIPFVVLKGPVVRRFYRSTVHRPYSDIDVVVSPKTMKAASAALQRAGYFGDPDKRQPWEWFSSICIEGSNLSNGEGGCLDLHHRIAPWVFGAKLSFRRLFDDSSSIDLGPLCVQAASVSHSVVIAALHVVNDFWKGAAGALTWRDLILLRGMMAEDDYTAVYREFDLEWLMAFIETSICELLCEGVGGPSLPAAPLKALRLNALGWGGATLVARHPAGWAVRLPAWRGALFLLGSLVPSHSYARANGGYVRYWRELGATVASAASGADLRDQSYGRRRKVS
jgi:hypothetical protein